MSLTSALLSQVAPAVRERGQEAVRAGIVTLSSVSPYVVHATFHGAEDEDVDLALEGRTVVASCTCEHAEVQGTPCKHIWATVLAAEPRGFAAGPAATGRLRLVLETDEYDDDYDDYDDEPRYQPFRPAWSPPPVPQAPARQTWKDQLAALRRETQPPASPGPGRYGRGTAERQPVYVIDGPTSTQVKKLALETHFRERKKNGEWGKPRPLAVSSSQTEDLTDPVDRQIVALLGGAERDSYGYGAGYYGYSSSTSRYRLSGPLIDAVLPLLAQTDRVRLRRAPGPGDLEEIAPDLDPPWELALTVTHGPGDKWVLAGRLRRGTETMPLAEPALLVPGLAVWNGRFGRFDDKGSFAWAAHLRRIGTIAVPAARGDDLLDQLLQMPHLPQLDLPEELRYTEEAVPPRPRLIVKPGRQYYGTPPLHAELSFEYDGQVVPANQPGRGIYRSEGRRFIPRDPAAEQAAARELTRLGLRPAWSGGEQKLELRPTLLPKVVKELVPAGWKVEAEGKLYRQPGEFKLAVESDRDWFDLNGAVDFEGRKVALPRLLQALNRGESTIPLDDGSFGMVPEDWLKKYGLLARMGTVEGDRVRFGRAQVGVLDALLASRPEISFDKQFARARAELRKFEGVAAADPPQGFKGELRAYQREGLGWLRFLRKFGFGGCLADDMGLGKTVQVLALLAGRRTGPVLVVVPRSLVFNWKQEAAKFAPKLKVLDHTGIGRDRTGAGFKDHDLVLTTYGTLRNDAETFAAVRFDTCVLDESQAAKNAETETAKAVKLVQADHRLALSGTPVENHLGELWTLFDFLNPGMLGRAALFGGATGLSKTPDPETREILARALRPFILRRTKAQVAKDLPQKTEQTVYCDLEPAQRKLYDELRDHYRQSLLARVDEVGLSRSKIQVLEALLRLRQAACHPGLIDRNRAKEPSAKLDVLLPDLEELAESGHKTLVFSQFTSLLGIVKSRLDEKKLTYEYLDGRTRDRAARVERFQTDPDCRLFLISLKAGGVGLNLTAAEYVFLLDPWWNPAVEAQAIDRTHRIGQTKPVFAYRLIARGTVEEKVLALQQSKRELADAILGGDGHLITDLKREDLELLLS